MKDIGACALNLPCWSRKYRSAHFANRRCFPTETLMKDQRKFPRRYMAWIQALYAGTYTNANGKRKYAVEGGKGLVEGGVPF